MLSNVVTNSLTGTGIMYKSMVSYDQLHQYMVFLLERKLLARIESTGYAPVIRYKTTELGQKFISDYIEMGKLMDGSPWKPLPSSIQKDHFPQVIGPPPYRRENKKEYLDSKLLRKWKGKFINRGLIVSKIREMMEEKPNLNSYQIAKAIGISRGAVLDMQRQIKAEKENNNKQALPIQTVG